ncbi:MAG: hypothetical protein DRI56_13745 [Chloroflexota bacterium]|nr:MAG: hypothetical protein DRI56_13745 [Chloroflexota bacterium]
MLKVLKSFTRAQQRIFLLLQEHSGKVVRYQALLNKLGKQDTAPNRKILSAHISRIRQKINHLPVTIDTITKQGYLLREEK